MAVTTEGIRDESGLKFIYVSDVSKKYQTSGQVVCIQFPAPLAGNWAADIIR
jgi:hypothetical protein